MKNFNRNIGMMASLAFMFKTRKMHFEVLFFSSKWFMTSACLSGSM